MGCRGFGGFGGFRGCEWVVEVSEVSEVLKVSEVVKNNLYAAITKSADKYAGSRKKIQK